MSPFDADHATAVVKFDNTEGPSCFVCRLVLISGAWKIHDIDRDGEEGTLRALCKAEA